MLENHYCNYSKLTEKLDMNIHKAVAYNTESNEIDIAFDTVTYSINISKNILQNENPRITISTNKNESVLINICEKTITIV